MRHESISRETAIKLRAGVEEARSHCGRFDMTFWAKQYDEARSEFVDVPSLDNLTYECKTTLCYASHLLLTAPKQFRAAHADMTIAHAAAKYADLTMDQMWKLFNVSNWPAEFYRQYNRTVGTPEAVDALADRVEYFIENAL
jgi:hypothetical protein